MPIESVTNPSAYSGTGGAENFGRSSVFRSQHPGAIELQSYANYSGDSGTWWTARV
jgi:hypothetical protein